MLPGVCDCRKKYQTLLTGGEKYAIFNYAVYCIIFEEVTEMDRYDSPVFTSLVEISRLANTLQSVMDMGMDDITSRQWLPLMILGRCETPPNLNQLAEKCGITRQSAKQLVDKLSEKNLVSIQRADGDKRNISIVITQKGKDWGKVNLERNIQFVTELFGGIAQEDIKTFASVQQRLLEKLENIKEQMKDGG